MNDEINKSLKIQKEESRQRKEVNIKFKLNFKIMAISSICIMLLLSVYLISDAFTIGAKAAADSFSKTKDAVAQATYDEFYDTAYDYAEEKHHVSNDVSISVERIQEEEKIEVLKVYDVIYEVSEEDDEVESWLEIPGYGIFTVDLRKSEFIVDNYNQYVLVRVASPVLLKDHFTLDTKNVKVLHFKEGVFDGAEDGINQAREQLATAERDLLVEMMNDQDNYLRAKKSAQMILVNIIKKLNPTLNELVVEVEFIE